MHIAHKHIYIKFYLMNLENYTVYPKTVIKDHQRVGSMILMAGMIVLL